MAMHSVGQGQSSWPQRHSKGVLHKEGTQNVEEGPQKAAAQQPAGGTLASRGLCSGQSPLKAGVVFKFKLYLLCKTSNHPYQECMTESSENGKICPL